MATKTGRTADPLLGFNYALEIGDKIAGYFTEASGIGSENEIIEERTVDSQGNEIVRKTPGQIKWQDVTLKRGITEDLAIWVWRQEIEQGKVEEARQNCSIIMFDRNYEEIARWSLLNAWPSKITGPSLKSDKGNEVGVEELTITHEGIKREGTGLDPITAPPDIWEG
ncbi:MAG: phage tail protein [Chloroflexi bacterium]|nr:phage tail protein [Chloroflexota bacterium]